MKTALLAALPLLASAHVRLYFDAVSTPPTHTQDSPRVRREGGMERVVSGFPLL